MSSGQIPETQAAGTYWTAARMASAKPVPNTIAGRAKTSSSAESTAAGPPVSTEPSAAGSASSTSAPEMLAAGAVPRPYTNYPDKLNGKVFFTGSGGGNFVCSGTAVNSPNKSIVWTAGHCVHGGRGSGWHRNWVFVPAYSSSFNGHRPYGTWTARQLWSRTEWVVNSNFKQDLGAVIVNRLNGVRLVDKIGGQGMAFNFPRNQAYSSFGYPQAAPFNGFLQWRCNSGSLGTDNPSPARPGPLTTKINCNMTGGCSGGGWLIRIGSNGLGYVNGLNSYRYGNTPNNLFGPYFGNEALSLYNTVKSL